jgi:hypothetical protein
MKQLANLEYTFHPLFYIKILQTLCSTYNKLDEKLYDFKMKFK